MPKRTENTGEDIFRFIQSAFAGDKGADHQEEPADVDIPPIEYKGQRVITTELLAQVYETTPKNIRMNFANHEDNFKEGIHYFRLHGKELSQFILWANDNYMGIDVLGERLFYREKVEETNFTSTSEVSFTLPGYGAVETVRILLKSSTSDTTNFTFKFGSETITLSAASGGTPYYFTFFYISRSSHAMITPGGTIVTGTSFSISSPSGTGKYEITRTWRT